MVLNYDIHKTYLQFNATSYYIHSWETSEITRSRMREMRDENARSDTRTVLVSQPHSRQLRNLGGIFSRAAKSRWIWLQGWLGWGSPRKSSQLLVTKKVKKLPRYATPGTSGFGIVRLKEGGSILEEEIQKKYRSGVGMLEYFNKILSLGPSKRCARNDEGIGKSHGGSVQRTIEMY